MQRSWLSCFSCRAYLWRTPTPLFFYVTVLPETWDLIWFAHWSQWAGLGGQKGTIAFSILCPHLQLSPLTLLLAPVFLLSLSLTRLFSYSLNSQKILVFRSLAELLTTLCTFIALGFTLSSLSSPDLVPSCQLRLCPNQNHFDSCRSPLSCDQEWP